MINRTSSINRGNPLNSERTTVDFTMKSRDIRNSQKIYVFRGILAIIGKPSNVI